MSSATIGKWGNSLAVRIPGTVAIATRLADGDRVEIETVDNAIVIRAAGPHFTAKALFAGKSLAEWRVEYANAYDWGPDVGREIVEE